MNCAIHTNVPATAYCRTCGKPLCSDCKRDVMGVIYCEPCIAARLHGTMPVAEGAAAAAGSVPPQPVYVAAAPDAPNPGLALVLGFIPGVGAMYNGQFLKGFIQVLVFAGLIWAADNIEGVFGLLVAGWFFYMVIDSFKTAKAKQLGLPAPDFLGINRFFGMDDSGARPVVTSDGTPAAQGPPVGAYLLMGLGLLFLMQTAGLMRLRAGLLWPLILIGVGAWMAYRRSQDVVEE